MAENSRAAETYPSNAEALKNPGINRGFEVVRLLSLEMKVAIDALEKIATGRIAGERDTADTARIMRGIAVEALAHLPSRFAALSPSSNPIPHGKRDGGGL